MYCTVCLIAQRGLGQFEVIHQSYQKLFKMVISKGGVSVRGGVSVAKPWDKGGYWPTFDFKVFFFTFSNLISRAKCFFGTIFFKNSQKSAIFDKNSQKSTILDRSNPMNFPQK